MEQGGGRWTKRRDFGRVPPYLLAIKLRLAQQQAAKQARSCGQGMHGPESWGTSCLHAQAVIHYTCHATLAYGLCEHLTC